MDMNLVRFMCAFICHLIILPEVVLSIEMIEFIIDGSRKHVQGKRPKLLVIALFKFISGMLAEFILMFLICQKDSIDDIIMDFVALQFIIELDNIFARRTLT